MGLMQMYIDVKNCSKTTKYYESLGYEIPKKISNRGIVVADYSKAIRVCVGDIPLSSTYKVKVKCDNCGCEHEIMYSNYIRNIRLHGGYYYCHKCCG